VASLSRLAEPGGLSELPIDHLVAAVELRGGAVQAQRLLKQFVRNRLAGYQHDRNEPDLEGSTGLSPYLHFGHLSCHQLFWEIMKQQQWNPSRLAGPNGKVEGFWGVDPNAEALLDQLCTWREIGLNMCWREPNYDAYDSLPTWALQTLDDHRHDPRAVVYDLDQLEFANTGDPIWNAAQRQLLIEGRMHNYLRMLWGKNILGWTKSPEQALQFMIELNNKYALDGRDPNSYSGIFWVLGRYDRAWGPERQVFGKIRYMTSQNTARKHALRQYLAKYSTLT
jgi:deoxyribodipyrimidine photo-lyase